MHRLLALPLLLASCITLDQFEGGRFQCSGDEDCPDSYWCHSKKLVTGGVEPGNVCVPMGEHWCQGQRCADGQRCSSPDDPSGAFCVPCAQACDVWRDGESWQGAACEPSACSSGESCIGSACAKPCSASGAAECATCRFSAEVSNTTLAGGGACASELPDSCVTQPCPAGSSCAILLTATGSPRLGCVSAGLNAREACRTTQDCASGLCVQGTCREACSGPRGAACSECDTSHLGFPSGFGFCR